MLSSVGAWDQMNNLPGAWWGVGMGGSPVDLRPPTFAWVEELGLPVPGRPNNDYQPIAVGGDSGGGTFYYPTPTSDAILGGTLCPAELAAAGDLAGLRRL